MDGLPVKLYLIGYRGTGKTTAARRLGERWHALALDLDEQLESAAGMTVTEIFAKEGEPAFRERETSILTNLAHSSAAVVSLGGGTLMRAENQQLVRDSGVAVWLDASVDTLIARVSNDPLSESRRPRLTQHATLREEIEALLAQRVPVYQELSEYRVETDDRSLAEVVDEIDRWWQARPRG